MSSTFIADHAAGYELQMGRWSRRLAAEFIDFVGIDDGEHVLDVGCGTGSLGGAVAMRTSTAQIDGVDLAAPYIEHASRINRDPRLRFSLGDACALTFPDHSFDRVLSLLVLHFVPRPLDAITEMRRVARPGAVVGAAVWDLRGGVVAGRLFFDTAAALDPDADAYRARHLTRPLTRPGELATAWRSTGLTDVVETTLAIRMEYSGFEDYWAPYEGLDGPAAEYVATLTPERRAVLRDAVCRAYLDGERDGPRSFATVAWAVKGRVPA
ncbi:MAG: class I SAM-dependent methyltransferase [Hyphomicrobiaceae bacterium]